MSVPLLEGRNLQREVPEARLLDNVSLDLSGGQRIALVGPSGSGKSLLLRALAMLDPVQGGQVRWHGQVVTGGQIPLFRSRVTYLHQRPSILEGTVEENLRLPFALKIHRHRTFDRPRIVELLQRLGREEGFLEKSSNDLSGGEQQLTALLRAIQLDPEVLLLDEPTAALDGQATEIVESLVTGWVDQQPENRASMWVTHSPDQAARIASQVFRIANGRVTEGDDGDLR